MVAPVEPGMTYYRGFSGEHAFFDPKVPEGVEIQSITDGTSNTIAVVEAREPVPWTKPDTDIPFDGDPTKLERHPGPSCANWAAIPPAGSMRCSSMARCGLSRTPSTWSCCGRMITRDGGEVVSSDSF